MSSQSPIGRRMFGIEVVFDVVVFGFVVFGVVVLGVVLLAIVLGIAAVT